MERFTNIQTTPEYAKGCVLTLGNFDGVHLGHQAIIRQVFELAKTQQISAGVMSFEPHPRQFFKPDLPPFRLSDAETKSQQIEQLGVDFLWLLNFNQDLAQLSANSFIEQILVDALAIKHIVVGHDFTFGKNRQGNIDTLRDHGGFAVTEIQAVGDAQQTYSSSAIRACLREGKIDMAHTMLGHDFTIRGTVESGDQRGRELGTPTANIALGDMLRPAYGVYAVTVTLEGKKYAGVANLGTRPTVDGKNEWLEVHLFDQRIDLYDKILNVTLVAYLRPEQRFASPDALKAQIVQDVAQAKEALSL